MVLPRLLVVDDDVQIRRAFTRTLGRHFSVECAVSGEEALARIDGGAVFDVILCDLHLAHMSGHDLYDELARRSTETAARFVIITGTDADEDDPFATLLGERYLTKTAPLPDLARTLHKLAFPLVSSPPVAA